jgi:hypothetical protein
MLLMMNETKGNIQGTRFNELRECLKNAVRHGGPLVPMGKGQGYANRLIHVFNIVQSAVRSRIGERVWYIIEKEGDNVLVVAVDDGVRSPPLVIMTEGELINYRSWQSAVGALAD